MFGLISVPVPGSPAGRFSSEEGDLFQVRVHAAGANIKTANSHLPGVTRCGAGVECVLGHAAAAAEAAVPAMN